MARESPHDYDVAFSFAGEDRDYVEAVAAFLKAQGVRVFYDIYEQVELWGKDLYVHLDEVYRKRARFCVMFISQHYSKKLWTNHERESAQARAFTERQEYILPARFDDTEIPGIRPTVGYVSLRGVEPAQLGYLILEKLGKIGPISSSAGCGADASFRKPSRPGRMFNPYDEALRLIEQLTSTLKRRCDSLGDQGVSATLFEREGRKCLRVVADGKPAYSLDVWMGGLGGDASLNFYGVRGGMLMGSGSTNAWGNIVWDKASNAAALAFHDLSLLSHVPGDERLFTFEQFADAVWNVVCDALESN